MVKQRSKKKSLEPAPEVEPSPVKTEPVPQAPPQPVTPVQPVAPPPPPPPPPPPVQAPPKPAPLTVKAVVKPTPAPPVKAPAKGASEADLSDEEVARLEAEFEAEEARKKAAKAAVKPPAPSKPATAPRPMPQRPPPKPIAAPQRPPVLPAPKPKATVPTIGSPVQTVSIKRDSMSQSIAGDGLAVTPEMAQMAADAGLCPSCGGTVSAEDANCTVCNQELEVPTWLKKKRQEGSAKKPSKASGKCPSCGEDIEPDFATCPSCGKKL